MDFSTWFALMGPANLPADVVTRVVGDLQKVLADPAVQARRSTAGVEPYPGNGADLVKLIRADKQRYAQLAKAADIKAE